MNQDYWRLIGQIAGAAAGAYAGDVSGGMQLGGAVGGAAGGALNPRPVNAMPSAVPQQPQRQQGGQQQPRPPVASQMPPMSTATPQFPMMPLPEVRPSDPLQMPNDDVRRRQQLSMGMMDPRIAYLANGY